LYKKIHDSVLIHKAFKKINSPAWPSKKPPEVGYTREFAKPCVPKFVYPRNSLYFYPRNSLYYL